MKIGKRMTKKQNQLFLVFAIFVISIIVTYTTLILAMWYSKYKSDHFYDDQGLRISDVTLEDQNGCIFLSGKVVNESSHTWRKLTFSYKNELSNHISKRAYYFDNDSYGPNSITGFTFQTVFVTDDIDINDYHIELRILSAQKLHDKVEVNF